MKHLVVAFVLLSAAPATAQEMPPSPETLEARPEIPRRLGAPVDTWSEPNPGVRYLRRTYEQPLVSVHVLEVDLRRARVVATPEDERWGSVSEYARSQGAAAAVNGGFWGLFQRPCGLTAGGGELWESSEPDPEFGHFGVARGGRAGVYRPGEGEDERSLRRLTDAVSGRPVLVTRGEVDTEGLDVFETSNLRQPRTSVGVSRDGRTVWLVVVDGRQAHSVGFTLYQLARTLTELGAWRAINLDGGGSSTMFVERAGGTVNAPARGRWVRRLGLDGESNLRTRRRAGNREVYVRGVEREVMNHLLVIADDPPEVRVAGGGILLDGLPAERPLVASFAPAQPLRIGRAREWLVPAGGLAFVLGVLWTLGRALWRFSSRRAGRRAKTAAARTRFRSSRT